MILILLARGLAVAAVEETYPLLQIGTATYTNVTVTTKAKKYIFIHHSGGMANIRVADLPPELINALGYADLQKKEHANVVAATTWAKQTLSRLKSVDVMAMEQKVQQTLQKRSPEELRQMVSTNSTIILAVLGGLFFLFLCFSFCCMLICKKAGSEPGVLVWLPVLQLFPMLRAAGMSPLWFLAYLFPVLNVLAQIILGFNLAKARGKSAWVGFFLLLPVTNILAFLYLAFSGGDQVEKPGPRPRSKQIMTLETA